MVGGQQNPVFRYLRRLAGAPPGGDPSDQELLQRFAHHRDEDSFTTIVEKYGPMVLGVCRRILHSPQDEEDAFQATFLVLVRKAGSLVQPGSLASWLYGVAYRTALKARALTAQRHFHETQAMAAQNSRPIQQTDSRDLKELLDEEVNRLPAKYRSPVILCYLSGKTNEQAARELGCPPGTIFSRLARARDILRTRLTKRGIIVSAAGLTTALTAGSTPAAVPAPLLEATVQAALAFAAGHALAAGAISAGVLTLTKGVQQAMFMNTLKIVLAAGLTVTVVGGGGVSFWALAHDSNQAEKRPGKQAITSNENPDEKGKREDDLEKPKIIVLVGGTRTLEMNAKKIINRAENLNPRLLEVRGVPDRPNEVLLLGKEDGTTRLILTAKDGTTETFEVIVQLADEEALKKALDQKKAELEALQNDTVRKAELEVLNRYMAELNLKRLLKDRVDTAKLELEARTKQFEAGKGTLDFLIGASKRLVLAELDATDKKAEQLSALKAHLERMKTVEAMDQERYKAGRISIEDLAQSKYYRLEAEIWLERAKAGNLRLEIQIKP